MSVWQVKRFPFFMESRDRWPRKIGFRFLKTFFLIQILHIITNYLQSDLLNFFFFFSKLFLLKMLSSVIRTLLKRFSISILKNVWDILKIFKIDFHNAWHSILEAKIKQQFEAFYHNIIILIVPWFYALINAFIKA